MSRTRGACGPNFTVTGGLRYSLFSPPYEVNGLQVAPTISMGQWFQDRAAGMLQGIPANKHPNTTFDLAGPKNNKRGFYETDKNNFAPRLFAWSPHAVRPARQADRRRQDGRARRLFEGVRPRRPGARAQLRQRLRVRHVDGHQQPVRRAARRIRRCGSSASTHAADDAGRASGGFPQTPPIEAGIITTSIDDTLVTPSAHMANFICRATSGATSRSRPGTSAASGAICSTAATPRWRSTSSTRARGWTTSPPRTLIRAMQAAGIPGAAAPRLSGRREHRLLGEPVPGGGERHRRGLSATQAIARRSIATRPTTSPRCGARTSSAHRAAASTDRSRIAHNTTRSR